MKNKFLLKTIGMAAAVAVTIGGIGVYNYNSEAVAGTSSVSGNISTETNTSVKEETKSTAKIPSGKAEKEETVYIFTNAKGERQDIIVSNHLKNTGGADNLQDKTSLSNIENVKGDESFNQNGENIGWKSNGSDIYYQGNTDKKPPVEVKVSYKLDGKDIEPEELSGKSGKVTIRYDYENNAGETKKINGKDEKVFVPFTMATALTLSNDKFSNITVTNGKVMSEGNNSVVLGLAFPKLAKSLGLDNKNEKFPEYFEITADVKDFSLGMTLTAALPDMLSDLIDTDSKEKNKLQENIDKLIDGVDELKGGTSELKEGTSKLKSKSHELKDGVNTLDSGSGKLSENISKLTSGATTLKTGIVSLKDGADKLSTGTDKLTAGLTSLKGGADKLSKGGTKLSSSLTTLSTEYSKINTGIIALVDKVSGISTSASKQGAELTAKINGYKEKMAALVKAYGSEEKIAANPADWAAYNQMKGAVGAMETVMASLSSQASSDGDTSKSLAALKEGSAKIDAALKTLAASSGTFSENLNKLSAASDSLSAGSKELKSGLNVLSTGADKLTTGAAALEEGTIKLDAGAKNLHKGTTKLNTAVAKLIDGIATLDTGAGKLKDGVQNFSSKLSDTDIASIFDHFDVVAKMGKDYKTFSGASENEGNSVKFVIKVEGIEEK
ncbi:MAG: hypothetical protein ACTTKP_11275 [Catonella sp.]|uniref:hypothetical protein n=1 Tax=Catonella sp. TaxID=2382125 RepID=UPI003FA08A1F